MRDGIMSRYLKGRDGSADLVYEESLKILGTGGGGIFRGWGLIFVAKYFHFFYKNILKMYSIQC